MIKATGLQHVGLFVENARKSADWYIETMGFKQIGDFKTTGGDHVIFVRSDLLDLTYEMVQRPAGSPGLKEVSGLRGKVDHLAYIVDDVEASFKQAKADKMDIIEGIIDIPEFWDHGFRYFMVKGAGGERVEFCRVL